MKGKRCKIKSTWSHEHITGKVDVNKDRGRCNNLHRRQSEHITHHLTNTLYYACARVYGAPRNPDYFCSTGCGTLILKLRKHDLASILLPVVNTKRPLLCPSSSNQDLHDVVVMSSTVSLGVSSSAGANPFHANAAALSTPLVVQASTTFRDCNVTSNDNSRTSLSSVRGGFSEPPSP